MADETRIRARVSAIVTTLGSGEGLGQLLRSLDRQTLRPQEVIIVDQNAAAQQIAEQIDGTWTFPVRHLHAPQIRGASQGRNFGMAEASGEILVFPDDDCWYPPDFLERTIRVIQEDGVDFVCGRAADEETGRTINGRFEPDRQAVTRQNVWTTSIEWLQIMTSSAASAVSGYDETIGVGASSPWQSAEAQDLLLRLLAAGFHGVYDPNIVGHHAELPVDDPDLALRLKLRRYARGMGHVLRLHDYGLLEASRWFLRPLAGLGLAVLKLNRRRVALYSHIAVGRLEGYFGRLVPSVLNSSE